MERLTSQSFELAALVEKCKNRGAPYLEFLRVPQLSCGIYTLAAGVKDTQSAHDEDEVYLVLGGQASLIVDGDETVLAQGSIVYVPADTQHEFTKIEEDLSLLVLFGSGGPSGAET